MSGMILLFFPPQLAGGGDTGGFPSNAGSKAAALVANCLRWLHGQPPSVGPQFATGEDNPCKNTHVLFMVEESSSASFRHFTQAPNVQAPSSIFLALLITLVSKKSHPLCIFRVTTSSSSVNENHGLIFWSFLLKG